MRFQSFDTAWKVVKKVEEKPIETTGIVEPKEVSQPEPEPKTIKKQFDFKKEELIIIGLIITCFFLFLWALSATLASNRIARLHSQLLDKLILNLANK